MKFLKAVNKWRGIKLSLRMGGQGHPTPINTPRLLPLINTHTQRAYETFIFRLFDLCVTDWQAIGRMKSLIQYQAVYRATEVACGWGRSSDEKADPSYWAGVVMQKPLLNAKNWWWWTEGRTDGRTDRWPASRPTEQMDGQMDRMGRWRNWEMEQLTKRVIKLHARD